MKRTSQHGFTLIELLVAVTLIAILLGLAAPGFREFTRNNRVTAAQNDLVTALNLARSESVRRSRPVSVCATADGANCADAASWVSGWLVFTDGAGGDVGVVDGSDEILQQWTGPGSQVTVSADQPYVQYLPTGTSAGPLTVDIASTACMGKGVHRVQISGTGALTSQLVSCP